MRAQTLLVSQQDSLTKGLRTIVEAWSPGRVETRNYPGPEDNTYYLSPETVETVAQLLADVEDPTLVVDGLIHPGQAIDLQGQLPSVTLYDRRSIVWAQLAPDNRVAETQLELRRAQISHRAAVAADRDSESASPSGTRGEVAALKTRIDTLRAQRDESRATVKNQATTSYTDVDGHIALVGRPGTPTTALWAELTGATPTNGAGRPAQSATGTTMIGPHTVAITACPGIPGDGGLPPWLEQVLPRLEVALERAAVVIGVGQETNALIADVSPHTAAACVQVPEASATAVQAAVTDHLEHRRFQVRLPYTDEGQSLLATLHDTAVVHDVVYDEQVTVDVTIAATAVDTLARRIDAIESAAVTPSDG